MILQRAKKNCINHTPVDGYTQCYSNKDNVCGDKTKGDSIDQKKCS